MKRQLPFETFKPRQEAVFGTRCIPGGATRASGLRKVGSKASNARVCPAAKKGGAAIGLLKLLGIWGFMFRFGLFFMFHFTSLLLAASSLFSGFEPWNMLGGWSN